MPTEECKAYLYDFLLKYYQDSVFKSLQQDTGRKMSESVRSASVSTSDAMICVECFRSKGDNEFAIPCQNPRCHFYLQLPREEYQRPRSESLSISNRPLSSDSIHSTFSKEVGHNRQKQKILLYPEQRSNCTPKAISPNIWAYKSEKQSFKMPQYSSTHYQPQRFRSQSTSVGLGASEISRSGANHHVAPYQGLYTSEGPRSRLMSVPMTLKSVVDHGGDLVEDAFLPNVGESITDEVVSLLVLLSKNIEITWHEVY